MSRPPKPWYWKARQAWYTDLGGVRRKLVDGPKNAETTRLAQLAFHRLMAQCLANPPIDRGNPTVACVVDDYLEQNKKDLAPSTFRENQMYLQKFCNEHGPRFVRDCIPYHLMTWVNAHPTWESNWTKSYAIRVVKRPFNWAVDMGLIEENPFASVKLPKCRNRRRPITLAEFEALLEAAGPTSRLGEILLFLWFTGCRPSELRHLQWGDIHLDRATPVIVIEEHKTSATQEEPIPRKIPILPGIATVLVTIAERQEHKRYVFVTHRRTPWARSSIQQSLRRLRRTIGLPEDVVLYSIRHGLATAMVRDGCDLRTTADALGHTNVRTTELYVHSTDRLEALAAAMARATSSLRCA